MRPESNNNVVASHIGAVIWSRFLVYFGFDVVIEQAETEVFPFVKSQVSWASKARLLLVEWITFVSLCTWCKNPWSDFIARVDCVELMKDSVTTTDTKCDPRHQHYSWQNRSEPNIQAYRTFFLTFCVLCFRWILFKVKQMLQFPESSSDHLAYRLKTSTSVCAFSLDDHSPEFLQSLVTTHRAVSACVIGACIKNLPVLTQWKPPLYIANHSFLFQPLPFVLPSPNEQLNDTQEFTSTYLSSAEYFLPRHHKEFHQSCHIMFRV